MKKDEISLWVYIYTYIHTYVSVHTVQLTVKTVVKYIYIGWVIKYYYIIGNGDINAARIIRTTSNIFNYKHIHSAYVWFKIVSQII